MESAHMNIAERLSVVHGLTSRSAHERRKTAGMLYIWDGEGFLDRDTARGLAPILAWAVLVETENDIREDLLDGLQSLTAGDRVAPEVLELVTSQLQASDLSLSERETMAALDEKVREYRRRDGR